MQQLFENSFFVLLSASFALFGGVMLFVTIEESGEGPHSLMATAVELPPTPYDLLGGSSVIAAIVDRFYDLIDQEPAFAALRAMHRDDLTPMRESLTGFLGAWSGGPRDWFTGRTNACMMSLHRPLTISPMLARQWNDAMAQAIAGQPGLDEALGRAMQQALGQLAGAMVNAAG